MAQPRQVKDVIFQTSGVRIDDMEVMLVHQSVFPGHCMLQCSGPIDRLGNSLNIRIAENQKLEQGDIVILRRANDPFQEALKPPANPMNMVPLGSLVQKTTVNHATNHVEQVHCDDSFADTLRKVTANAFPIGPIHQVRRLTVGFIEGILRLPVGLQLKVEILFLNNNSLEVLNALNSILHESSFPLKELRVTLDSPRDPILENLPVCGELFLSIPQCKIGFGDWRRLSELVQIPKIYLTTVEIGKWNWLIIATKWIQTPRPLGSRFAMDTAGSVKEYLEAFKQFKGGDIKKLASRFCPQFPTCLSVRLSGGNELNVYGTRSELFARKDSDQPWMIVFEVMPAGSAEGDGNEE